MEKQSQLNLTFNFSSAEDDLVKTTAKLLQLVVPWLGLSRDNSQDNGKTGKDSDDLGHGDEELRFDLN